MDKRTEIINELLKKMFEYSGNYPPYENLRETQHQWRGMYTMPQDAKIKWINWGTGYLQRELGLPHGRAQMEMQMLDQMWGLKTQ